MILNKLWTAGLLVFGCFMPALAQSNDEIKPSRTEQISPIIKKTFREDHCPQRVQGGGTKMYNGYMQFNGAMDGNRQVDPQIAVGGGYVLHATNSGLIIYDKEGVCIDGVSQNCFNKGIDPKMFFDTHNKVFGFDLWNPWDAEKKKPVNIAISKSDNPTKGWNIYPVPAPKGVDGGGIGFSKKWIGYSFPGGEEKTFVMSIKDAKKGKETTVYHFEGTLGHPVFVQDDTEDLFFFTLTSEEFIITKVTEGEDGTPVAKLVSQTKHNLEYTNYPPKSPQKDTEQKTSSGDRNPKNLVFQNGCIWFSHAVNYKGRSAVQWHQVKTDGTIVQTGLIENEGTNYIQTTIAVNKNNDVVIGFQETNENMFISPRFAYRHANDPLGEVTEIVNLGEGKGATDGTSWGDYSGSVIDGDNLTDLWTVQSIANKYGKGETVIVKVPFQEKK
ncbi:hypothetical protein [Aestuariibaculum suncheonense]|uniref:Uncharacterized protein n=1 Tax=Aestuariibaculum suncheonense TaxID=1028745 RepID=A0A8J6UC62_9FLAO|nr:hypothetical protein [Aestuariibaculum suncheonense]MBD0836938.1 hypothetical protein [Aestuariibaculum suncheonense]